MKPIAIINNTSKKYLEITFIVTNTCNYNCSYCWPDCHAGTSRWPVLENACKSFDHIINTYRSIGKEEIRLHLTGGEPTLWPELKDFINYVRDKHDIRITITTNGSRTVRWWNEHAELFNDVHISLHHQFADINHIIDIANTVYSKQTVMIGVGSLMDPEAWDACVSNVDAMLNSGSEWMVKVVPLQDYTQEEKTMDYTEQQAEYISEKIKRLPPQEFIDRMKELKNIQLEKTDANVYFDNGEVKPYKKFDLMSTGQNSFLGWHCHLIKDRIMISHTGKIHTNCFETNLFNGKDLNIYQDDFVENFTTDMIGPVRCSQAFCGCPGDLRLTKYKNEKPI